MPDWKEFILANLTLNDLEGLREERIAEELALQLEDIYSEALERGLPPEEAEEWTRSQVPDWELFSRLLSRAEHSNRRPVADVMMEASEEKLRRRGRIASVLADLLQDVRHTFRSVRTQPVFWITTVLILGLGIGATTTIFSVVDAVLLKQLPYDEPERIAFFQNPAFSPPRFVDWKEQSTSFEYLAGVWTNEIVCIGGDRPAELSAGLMTPDFFEIFGARTALGRLFLPEDFAGPPTRAVLGYGTWQRLFGSDPDIIGHVITLNGIDREIVGVLDPSFTSPQGLTGRETDVWLAMDPRWGALWDPGVLILSVFGRVRPEITIPAAEAELNRIIDVLAVEKPAVHADPEDGPRYVTLSSLQVAMTGDTRTALLLLLGAVILLLGIAAANIANIFLARGLDRIGEVGVRAAMGASRGRIAAQLLTESATLALCGGIFGVILAFAGVRAFEILNPGNIPLIERIAVDWRVLLFALAISLVTGLLFGLVPALRAARLDISGMMNDSLRTGSTKDRDRLRTLLVGAEIALALILLTGAGLLFNSFLRLQAVHPGFDPDGLVGVELNINGLAYPPERRLELVQRLDQRLESLPEIAGVATGITVPFQSWGRRRRGWLRWDWKTPEREDREIWTMVHPATADYFTLLGADLRGRTFQPGDKTAWPVPVIVSETFAAEICPGRDALGQTIWGCDWRQDVPETELRIIGIVSGLHGWGLDQSSEKTVFPLWEQYGPENPLASLLIKVNGNPAAVIDAIRETIWSEDPDMPLDNIYLLEDQIAESLAVPRFFSTLFLTFAITALLLSAGGVYAAVLYSVGRQRRELGIRTALGADRSRLIRLVQKRTLIITVIGVLVGAAGAWFLTDFLESMVFGITVTDPVTFVLVSLIMTAVALTASYLPARKATTTDPMEVLRQE